MPRSRYANSVRFSDGTYGTWDGLPVDTYDDDPFKGVRTFEHVVQQGDRLDTISARFLGDDRYWWVIALMNTIVDPFSIEPGDKLRVPVDVEQALERIG